MSVPVHRRFTLAALLALAIAAVTALTPGAAQAIPNPPDYNPHGRVYNGASPRCLDSGTPQGALLFNCSTSIYQQWTYSLRTGRILGNSPFGCLDAGAGLNGSRAVLAPCNGLSSQLWYGSGSGTFVNAAGGRCLDADLGTIGGQGTLVQVWDCAGGANQNWYFEFQ